MKVKLVEAIPVSVPRLSEQNIVVHSGANISADFVIIRICTDEGLEGHGEASLQAGWTGEDQWMSKRCIDHYLGPAIVGKSPFDLNALVNAMNLAIPWHPYSKAGVEMALWDIAGKALNRPLYDLLGGRMADRVAIKLVCAGPDVKSTVNLACRAVESGFQTIKLKTGFGVERDVATVREVRTAPGAQVRISIDSNQGWEIPEAIEAIRRMEEWDILFAEQPVPAWNPRWMAQVRESVNTPIAAHESTRGVWDGFQSVDYRNADIWAITPGNHGGLIPAKRLLALAEGYGIPCLIGSTVELGIATAALLHLAVSSESLAGERFPSDILGPLYYAEDLTEDAFNVTDGFVSVPEGPGLGIHVSDDMLTRYRID